jgi:hypothetical protein
VRQADSRAHMSEGGRSSFCRCRARVPKPTCDRRAYSIRPRHASLYWWRPLRQDRFAGRELQDSREGGQRYSNAEFTERLLVLSCVFLLAWEPIA